MIKFSDNLYTTKATAPCINIIRFKLISGIGTVRYHLITLASNGDDVFDIYPAMLFKNRRVRKRDYIIVGVAESKRAAMKLVLDMIKDCEKNTGKVENLREYFEKVFF